MFFGSLPLDEAEGALLAHGLRFAEKSFKKGHVLSAADIDLLRAEGVDSVIAARLGPDDVGEDVAADGLAGELVGGHIEASRAFTGRVNLFTRATGLLTYPSDHLQAFNRVDESITLAALPPFTPVVDGQMVATLKIIPFAIAARNLDIARSVAKHGAAALFNVVPFKPHRAGLIQTRLPGTKDNVLDKTRAVTAARLDALNSQIVDDRLADHTSAAVAAEIRALAGAGVDLILISGASAVVDRRDVVPAAIEDAGGQVDHFGMPVDPGNLMLLGHVDGIPTIGLPGCARSPKINGFDWVLQRVIAGLPVGGREIMSMGIGGFLKEIPIRPLPRAAAADRPMARAPRIVPIILAAGQSRRMGPQNKMTAPIDGVPMVRRTVENLAAALPVTPVVVSGHDPAVLTAALAGLDVKIVHNPRYAEGLSTSLIAGIGALDDDADGALVCLADMPRVTGQHIDKLIAAFDPVENRAICVPTFGGKRGNPVLWGRSFFDAISRVSGDTGARHLIGEHGDQTVEVEVDDDGVLYDIDTPEMLAAANQQTDPP